MATVTNIKSKAKPGFYARAQANLSNAADKARGVATSDNAKTGYWLVGISALIVGVHAAQVYVTKRILLS